MYTIWVPAARISGDVEGILAGGDGRDVGPWHLDLHPALEGRGDDDEDDQEGEGHVHQGGDVDLRIDGKVLPPGPPTPAAHRQTFPSRASVPMNSLLNPSISPVTRFKRETKWL